MNLCDALLDSAMPEKLRLKLVVNGEEWEHYEDRGVDVPGHTRIKISNGEGESLRFVVKKMPKEIEAVKALGVELRIGKECRPEALVALHQGGIPHAETASKARYRWSAECACASEPPLPPGL